jgi:hypothetical protein
MLGFDYDDVIVGAGSFSLGARATSPNLPAPAHTLERGPA